jgi:DNA-binding response OmpR family regulator
VSVASILVVEDEPTLAKNVRRYLQGCGFEVRVAATGAEAMAALIAFRPGVVLLDYCLPDADGLALLASIRQHDKAVRVVMVSGAAEAAAQALAHGACDHVIKPVALRELRLVLERALLGGETGPDGETRPEVGTRPEAETGAERESEPESESASAWPVLDARGA